MNKKEGGYKLKKVIPITLAVLLTAALVYAQPFGKGRMADRLNLTDQQQEQFETLKLKLDRDLIKPQSDLKAARLDLKEIMMQPNIDEKAALKKQDQISSFRADIARIKLQHKIAAGKVLTADQRAQMKKMHRGMAGLRGRGRGFKNACDMMGSGMGPMDGGMMRHQGMGGQHQMGPGWRSMDQTPKPEQDQPNK
jgi:Spy/CpxP family protein refolding chaperone